MKKILQSYPLIFIFIIVSIFLVVMVFFSRTLNEFFMDTSDYNIRMRLAETGKRLSEMVTVEELSMYMEPEDMALPEYRALKNRLVEFAEDSEVLYAYYLRVVDDGLIQYIIDNDYNEETVVGLDTPPYEPGGFGPVLEVSMAGQVGVSDVGQYVPGWEGLISAYAPMFDSDGNLVAIAGVDIEDMEIANARMRVRVLIVMEIITVLAVLFYGIYGFITYHREMMIAQEANEAKSRFLSLISHEIRTPMNAILGITEILLRDESLSPEAEDKMEEIYDSGDLLLSIVNDMLDMSKIEAGKMEIVPIKYDILSLLNDTVQVNRIRYESKPIEFVLDIDENTPLYLFGDELRIRQILNNILSNAFKYTEKGEIKMSVSAQSLTEDEVTLIFSISDTGQGMSEEALSRLFTEYTRFNQEANRNTIGIGLGMNITKYLVDKMDGEINVESKVNEGSVFTVRLPQKRVNTLVCGSEVAERLRNFRFHSSVFRKKGNFIREYMPYGRVLVVDDVASNTSVAKGLLMPYSLKVDTAGSGFEAIDIIKAGNTYDIIFMDHMMPEMDGIETVKKLREMGYTGCIAALSANALKGQADIFLENGFDAYVSKPIDSRELNLVLNEFIRDKKPPEVVEAARQEEQKRQERQKPQPREDAAAQSDLLQEVVDSFILDAERAIDTLGGLLPKSDAWSEKQLNLFRITVHGMKGALYNIGEKTLSESAYKLEHAAIDGDIDLIKAEAQGFVDSLSALLGRLQ